MEQGGEENSFPAPNQGAETGWQRASPQGPGRWGGKEQLSACLFSLCTTSMSFSLLKAYKYSLLFRGCRLLYLSHHALSSRPSSLCNYKQFFFLYPKDSILQLMLCDKSALIRSQLIYVYSTSKWFNTSSNDLCISDFLMPEKAPAEVYGSRTIKPSIEQYIIAGDYMLETTDLSRTE